MKLNPPTIKPEIAQILSKYESSSIIGFDEVGRGPLAGPVVAGAVIIPTGVEIQGLSDSKILTEAKRDALSPIIKLLCPFGIGWVWPNEIEEINIHQASLLAMKRAFDELCLHYGREAELASFALIDGLHCPDLPKRCLSQVKGDLLIQCISAASIIAKTARDAYMVNLDEVHPGYEFAKHKGYATSLHRSQILKLGPSPVHRKSFLRNLLRASSSETELPFEAP